MKKLILAVFLLLSGFAFGQAAQYTGTALTSSGTTPVILPSASITVCNFPATVVVGSACTNKANVCTDSTGGTCNTASNPFTADTQGNLQFYALPGAYDYTICPTGGGTCGGADSVAGVTHVFLGPVLNSNNSWGGVNKFISQLHSSLPLAGSNQFQLHFNTSNGTDSGGYLISDSTNGAIMAGGAAYNGTNFIAKETSAGIFSSRGAQLDLFQDTGLTVTGAYTPTSRFQITTAGLPTFPQGTVDFIQNGNCTTLSAASHGKICYDNGSQTFKFSVNGGAYTAINSGSSGYTTVQSSGAGLTQRSILNFTGGGISIADNAGSTRTDVTLPSTYQTVQQAGAPLTQRATVNFLGSGVSCVDNAGQSRTDCTVTPSGSILDSQLSSNVSLYDQVSAGRANDNATFGHGTASFSIGYKAGDGNGVNLITPDSVTTNTAAASITVQPGLGNGTSAGSNITLNASNAGTGGGSAGGNVTINAGAGRTTGPGGQISINGGGGGNNAAGGNVTISAGNPGGGNNVGGNLQLTSGLGNGTGASGNTIIKAGLSGSTATSAGFLQLVGGNNTLGTGANNGGDIVFTTGSPSGTGVHGRVLINGVTTTEQNCSATNFCIEVETTDGRPRGNANGDARGYAFLDSQAFFSGWCSGVATSSQTIFLFGLGIQATSTCTVTSAPAEGTIVASAGILRNLCGIQATGGVNASSSVIAVVKNGVASALTVTLGTGTTKVCDTTHTVAVAQGDLLSLSVVTQAAEVAANIMASFEKN